MLPQRVRTLGQAIEFFTQKSTEGKVPNRKTGGLRSLSPAEISVVVSHVTTAVRAASGSSDPLAVELAPYLEVLVDFAKRDAEEHGRSAKREASSVRLFLSVVEGREIKTQRRVVRHAILPAWLPLYDALTRLKDRNGNRRNPRSSRYPGYLYGLQSFLQLRGIRSPRDLPVYKTLWEWADEDGIGRKKLDNWFTAYRAARSAYDPSLPDLAPSPVGRHRGLRGLENLDPLVRQAAARDSEVTAALGDRTAYDVDQRELITMLAPSVGEAVELYLNHTSRSSVWMETVVTSMSCFLAELVRMGRNDSLVDLDLLDLVYQKVTIRNSGARMNSTKLLERHLGGFEGESSVSLLRAVVDAAARRSFAASPIGLVDDKVPDDEVPFYTAAMFNDLSAVWAVTDFVYGQGSGAASGGLAKLDPPAWTRIRTEYELLRQHMKEINRRRQPSGHVDKSLLAFTWSALVCAGLSRLWKDVRQLRDRYHEVCGKCPEGTPARAKARRAYHRKLKDYILAAILLDDGLRIKNYARGRVGVNFIPDVVRDETGHWDRIVGLTTRFRGFDASAGLKIQRDAGGKERDRRRAVLPGIVDMELLTDYWLEARPHDLAACGLIGDVDAYGPDDDRFALFVSPHSTKPSGAYSPPSLSKRFGKFVHGFMRDVLGRDIPDWNQLRGRDADPEAKAKWRGLLGAHPARLFIASYVGGIRNRWSHASVLTNDAIATLQKYYTEVKPFFEDAKKNVGIEHPHHFDRVVDVLWSGEVIDWASFDPNDPAASIPPEGGEG
jgi:hypothetical protein